MKKQKTLINEHHYKIVLQQLAENEYFQTDIDEFDFKSFSNKKMMFDYQSEALQNAFRVLSQFYNNYSGDKESFYKQEYQRYPHKNIDYQKPNDLIREFFPITGNRVEFCHFVNRMGFWLTMGSGKTIIIIKLIELLDRAIASGFIPKKNILFFTANEELLNRFKKEVEDYNLFKDRMIDAIDLKHYEERKKFGSIFDSEVVKLFCYRADLISDERKEATLDFRDYLDGGNNYVILDEAHKGDKQDSKRQNIFSILAKNGFLFNFSATFTDESDIITTIYNLNQAIWVKKGYGKKLFLLDNDLRSFKEKTDLNQSQKQKAILKSLLLLALAKKYRLSDVYHDPMMVVFTNSVNIVEADAELFFKILQSIIKDDVEELFQEAKEDLKGEFKTTKYLISDEEGEGIYELAEQVAKISLDELKNLIFYATSGNIEAIINTKDRTEIAFRLDSTPKPFCLIKIGNINSWLKEKLKGIKIDETFKEDGYFKSLDHSSINILLGSRSFYEGWDTTRPNIMLFLNIGMDKETKKFITQSIGRGMRVESVNGSRQRIDFVDADKKASISRNVKALETLFIVSTNKEAINSIILWQEEQNKTMDWCEIALEKNNIEDKMLYIPTYKSNQVNVRKISNKNAFKLSVQNRKDLRIYINCLGQRLFALKHNFFNQKECNALFDMINDDNSFFIDKNIHYKSLDFLIDKLKSRLYVKQSKVDSFKSLSDEIMHFKKIKVREDEKEEFFIMLKKKDFTNYKNINFQRIPNHYYQPIITGGGLGWIKNIVSQESEIVFLTELEKISKEIEDEYDWWMFSKLNEHYDRNIFIPYTENGEEKSFYPDFIFWLQKGMKQTIVFVDSKGNKHTSYEHKVDGYENVFLCNNQNITFKKDGIEINVRLALIKISNDSVGKKYENYWYSKDNLKSIFR